MTIKKLFIPLFLISTLTSCSGNPAEYIASVFNPDIKAVDETVKPKKSDEVQASKSKRESFLDKLIFWDSNNYKSKSSDLNIYNVWSTNIGSDRDAGTAVLQPSFDGKNSIYTIDTDGLVTATDINSGDISWKFDLNLDVTSGLLYHNGHLYFGTADGKIFGYRVDYLKENSSILSSIDIVGLINDSDIPPSLSLQLKSEIASPAVGIDDFIYFKQGDGDTVAINLKSKEVEWTHQGKNVALSLKGSAAITIDSSNLYVARDDGNFISLTNDTGKLNWLINISPRSGRNELESLRDVEMSPLIKDGIVYVGSFQGSLVSVDVITGEIIWRRSMSVHSNSAIDDYIIYLPSNNGDIVALDRFSGEVIWSTVLDKDILFSQPVLVNNYLLSFGTNGYVVVLNKDDGAIIHYNKLLGLIDYQSNVLTVNNTVYIVTKDGRLNAIRLN